jgi:hypothetical protein
MSLNPNAVPSANFDLSDWKLQLPVNSQGALSGKAAEVKTLTGYVHGEYFYTGSDGAMVLGAPVNGATTGGSLYARSELREMNGTANAEWSLQQGGHLSATLQVDAAPRHADGSYGKIVVGQVHGGDEQLVRLAWEDGTLFFANDITSNGTKDVHIELRNARGEQPSVSLNETFSYTIDVSADRLVVSVMADGQVYSSSSAINDSWNDNSFYFKAGAYLGVNENNGSGQGQVSIFALDASHTPDAPHTPVEPPTAKPDIPPAPIQTATIYCALPAPHQESAILVPQSTWVSKPAGVATTDIFAMQSDEESGTRAIFGAVEDDLFSFNYKTGEESSYERTAGARAGVSDFFLNEFFVENYESSSKHAFFDAQPADINFFRIPMVEATDSFGLVLDQKSRASIFEGEWF